MVAVVPVVFGVDDTRRSNYGNKNVSKSCDGNAVLVVVVVVVVVVLDNKCPLLPLPAAAAAAAAA